MVTDFWSFRSLKYVTVEFVGASKTRKYPAFPQKKEKRWDVYSGASTEKSALIPCDLKLKFPWDLYLFFYSQS